MISVGLIGFGRFGKLIAKYLSNDFDVYVFDKSNQEDEIIKLKATPTDLRETCDKDIIIPAVPISGFEDLIKKIKPYLNNNLVIDVCSVKEYPAGIMRHYLPRNVEILATHPMFGPDSAATTLVGKKIVLCKTRLAIETYDKVKMYLKKKGLVVIETTPKEHDLQIARTQVLTHFIGRSLVEFGAENHEIDTEGYRRLMHILGVVKNDTWQLFEDMNKYNKQSKAVRKEIIESLLKIDERLKYENRLSGN